MMLRPGVREGMVKGREKVLGRTGGGMVMGWLYRVFCAQCDVMG